MTVIYNTLFFNCFQGVFLLKKVLSLILCVLLVFSSALCVPSYASYNSELDTEADIALLFSLDDGTVIFDKNADKVTAPASLTKITTAILTLENCPDLDTVVTVPKKAITLLNGTGSSMAGLKADEQVTVRELLYCMLVKSANEAANTLADYIGGGDIDKFVGMMNDFVVSLGCQNTHFDNPHGLDSDGQYTTANDLALIVKHALTIPTFLEICNVYKYKMPATNLSPERNFTSTNWMINPNFKTYYYEYAQGIKTGTTSKAGHCFISKASKDGYNYVCIIMGAPARDVNGDGNDENCAFLEAKKLYKWVFENIRLQKIADTTKIVTVIDVKLSLRTDHVRLVPANDVTALVPVGTDGSSVLIEPIPEETPTVINAPIKKGEKVGRARIMYAQTEIATVDLVAAEDVNVNIFLWIVNIFKNVFTSPFFIVLAVLAVIVLAVYLVSFYKNKSRRKKQHKKPKVYLSTSGSKRRRPPQNNRRR